MVNKKVNRLVPQGKSQKSKRRQYRLFNDLEWLVYLHRVVLGTEVDINCSFCLLTFASYLDSIVSTRKRSTEAIKSRDTPTKCCKAPETRCAS